MTRRPPRSTLFPYPTLSRSLSGASFGGDRREPSGAEDVGRGEQARDQVSRWQVGGGDEGAVGERDPSELRLGADGAHGLAADRKSTRLNSSHSQISYALFCL